MLTKLRKCQIVFVTLCVSFVGYQYLTDSDTVNANKLAVSYSSQQLATTTPSIDYGKRRATIALQEYSKGVEESVRGCNCGPEVDKYTEGNPAQWCTMFASWVTMQAGSPMTDRVTQSWRIANSRVFETNLKTNGAYFTKSDILTKQVRPQLGDYIILSRGGEESGLGHVGIVVEYDAEANTVGLVSGNFRDKIAYQRNYQYLEQSGFLGFGRPERSYEQ